MLALDVHTWQVARDDANAFVFRPSALTAFQRMGISLVCILIAGGIYSGYRAFDQSTSRVISPEDSEQLREMERLTREMERDAIDAGLMTQEELDAKRQQREEQIERARSDTALWNTRVANILLGFTAFFGLIAIVAPLSAYWESVRVSTDAYGRLAIRQRDSLGWARTKRFEPGTFTNISLDAFEHQVHAGNHVYRTKGWMWHVMMQSVDGSAVIDFSVDLNPHRPLEDSRVPERVSRFADAFARFAGCSVSKKYKVLDLSSRERGFARSTVSYTSTPTRTLERSTRKTIAYEDASPAMRAMMDRVREQGGEPVSFQHVHRTGSSGDSESITFQDAEGNVCTYASPDDMPLDVRALYESLRRG